MKRPVIVAALTVAVVALWVLNASLYTVGEGQQALVVRLGRPLKVAKEPGLKIQMPLIDTVIYYDTRLLSLAPPSEEIILGDQKRIVVDTYTRFRIVDPLKFYQALRTIDQARAQLTEMVSSSLRRELGQIMLPSLLSGERERIVGNIHQEVADKARALGMAVLEVGILRADLPLETSQAIYDRMKSERQREAKELRAQGFEWAQEIQAKADRERTVILSEAQGQATVTRGAADAEANQLYADAFGKDPRFYRLYRSLQTYRQALAGAGPTLVLSPDAEFLNDLKTGPTDLNHN